MPAVTVAEMLAAERAAFEAGWSAEALLDLAGSRLGRAIARFFPHPGTAIGYLGKGHNAGDTLVALAILRDEFGWSIAVRQAFPDSDLAPLVRAKAAEHRIPTPLLEAPKPIDLKHPLLLIDGLVGIGSRGPLRPPIDSLAREMNQLRTEHGALVAAVDLPSGINADTGESGAVTVTADVTFMIANAKVGLLSSLATPSTGALAIVPIEVLSHQGNSSLELFHPAANPLHKAPRPHEFHKGSAGRVSILAGSLTYSGAVVLCATGALRAGAGLIRLFVPKGTEDRISARCPPEIIVTAIDSHLAAFETPADAMVIGCGLGPLEPSAENQLLECIANFKTPTVLDADALNIIAKHQAQHLLRPHHVITPHPGEFSRLAPSLANLSRESAVQDFCKSHPCTLLLKGARTLVSSANGVSFCNPTGHPGMACGGQGDLLAGVIGALLAGGLQENEAASLGAWLCGRASEIAIWQDNHSAESLAPSDTAGRIGMAFQDWRRSLR